MFLILFPQKYAKKQETVRLTDSFQLFARQALFRYICKKIFLGALSTGRRVPVHGLEMRNLLRSAGILFPDIAAPLVQIGPRILF
jgi:hypothetical protein